MAAAMLLFSLTSPLAHVKHARAASAKWQCGPCNTSYKGYGRSGEPRSRRAKAWRRNSRSSHDSRMPTSCPPQYVSRTSSTGPHRRSLTISKPKSQALLLILVAHVSSWFVLQRRSADDGSASLLRPAALFAPGIPTHTHDEASMPQNLVDSPNAPGTKKLGIPALCAR